MPAKNIYHDAVREALVADGWIITHDPFTAYIDQRRIHIDLAAGRGSIGAERGGERIAIEVQSFLSASPLDDLYRAVGQYVVYGAVLGRDDPDRELFLAVPVGIATLGILGEPLGRLAIAAAGMKLLVFHPTHRRVEEWRR
jgi:hypothetical protein